MWKVTRTKPESSNRYALNTVTITRYTIRYGQHTRQSYSRSGDISRQDPSQMIQCITVRQPREEWWSPTLVPVSVHRRPEWKVRTPRHSRQVLQTKCQLGGLVGRSRPHEPSTPSQVVERHTVRPPHGGAATSSPPTPSHNSRINVWFLQLSQLVLSTKLNYHCVRAKDTNTLPSLSMFYSLSFSLLIPLSHKN